MGTIYWGRKAHRHNEVIHWAEVVVQTELCDAPTLVTISAAALESLRVVFGRDYEHQRHCVWAGVAVQLDIAGIAGELPRVEAAWFRAEVVGVQVSGDAGREVSGFLLFVAGMNAVGAFLNEWQSRDNTAGR